MNLQRQIFEETEQLLEKKGLEKLSVNEIAENAGVSKRTLYKYFPSKKELISKIITSKHQQIKKEIEKIIKETGNEAEKYDRFITVVTEEVSKMKRGLFESLKKYPDLYQQIKVTQSELRGEMEKMVEQGIVKGEIKNDYNPKIVAFLLVKLANIIFDPDFLMNHKITFQEVTANLKQMVLTGLISE